MLEKVVPRNDFIQLQNKNQRKPFIKGVKFNVTHEQGDVLTTDN